MDRPGQYGRKSTWPFPDNPPLPLIAPLVSPPYENQIIRSFFLPLFVVIQLRQIGQGVYFDCGSR